MALIRKKYHLSLPHRFAIPTACFSFLILPYFFPISPFPLLSNEESEWFRKNVKIFFERTTEGENHRETKKGGDHKKDDGATNTPQSVHSTSSETTTPPPATTTPSAGNSPSTVSASTPAPSISTSSIPFGGATLPPSIPSTGHDNDKGTTSAAVDDATLPFGNHAPIAAAYHYGEAPTLTPTELITAAGAGILGTFGGVLLVMRGERMKRRVRRAEERRAAGIADVDDSMISRYRAAAGTQRLSGIILIAVALGIFLGTAYGQHLKNTSPIVFSKRAMLSSLWEDYKKNYIEPTSGRTLDRQRENITTSEGQSYTMLRAVWQDDKATFDKSLAWTNKHLRREDNLFSWLYGRHPNGSFGVLSERGGANSAADADTDIALALVFAYSRWGEAQYLEQARAVIDSIWEKEVVTIAGTPYLASNSVEKTSTSPYVLVNPSYFAPYAYRIFAAIDRDHPWELLVDSSYELIEKSASLPLGKEQSVGLPPNWLYLDKRTGAIVAAPDTDYGFDAMRVPWRLALDHAWFNEPRAKEVLEGFSFIKEEWKVNKKLPMVYAHDGTTVLANESPAFYGGIIGYFKVAEPRDGKKLYREKLEILYSPDSRGWKKFMSYYDDNWAWFGIALHNDALPNLASDLSAATLSRTQ